MKSKMNCLLCSNLKVIASSIVIGPSIYLLVSEFLGRDKELVKPTLQLFQGSKSQGKLAETFQTILDLKNSRKATSLHSALLDVAVSAIPDIDKPVPTMDGKVELLAKEFWSKLPDRITGQQDPNRPGEYNTTEFGTLYKRTVGTILHDNFGVESQHTNKGALYTFNRHTINRLRSQLNTNIKVTQVTQMTQGDRGGNNNSSTNNNENNENNDKSEREKDTPLSPTSSLASPTSPTICQKCGETLDPQSYYQKLHRCEPKL